LTEMPIDLALFRLRLAEAIAWCAPRASDADPKHCLRTPSLRPRGWGEAFYNKPELLETSERGIWINPEECILWLEDLDTPFAKQLIAVHLIG
jgi:hypothetical protein